MSSESNLTSSIFLTDTWLESAINGFPNIVLSDRIIRRNKCNRPRGLISENGGIYSVKVDETDKAASQQLGRAECILQERKKWK